MPVTDAAQGRECARQYATRWLIEEFHKALKTGLGADKLQLKTGARLKAAVALMSVVAVRLLALKEQARVDPQAPAEKSGLAPEELRVLAAATERRLTTAGEVILAVGRLGGHMNRKNVYKARCHSLLVADHARGKSDRLLVILRQVSQVPQRK